GAVPMDHRLAQTGPADLHDRHLVGAIERRILPSGRCGDNRSMAGMCSALGESGFVWIRSAFATPAAAFATSRELIDQCTALNGHEALSVIGDFVLSPPDGRA